MPVSILAAAGIFAGISALPGQSAITVAAGPTDSVFLRGLVITSEGGNNGILFSSGGALYLENMIVRGYAQVGQVDVNFQPTGAAKLFLKDSRIQSGATGLRIANAGADIGVTVDNVRFENNGTGIKAIANGQLTVRNSIVAGGSQDGISLTGANALPLTAAFDKLLVTGNAAAGITSGGTLPVFATVSRTTVRGNGGTGIFVSNGATASITRVTQSTITRNVIGVATGAGGTILSRGNNTVEANNADGSFSGPLFRQMSVDSKRAAMHSGPAKMKQENDDEDKKLDCERRRAGAVGLRAGVRSPPPRNARSYRRPAATPRPARWRRRAGVSRPRSCRRIRAAKSSCSIRRATVRSRSPRRSRSSCRPASTPASR